MSSRAKRRSAEHPALTGPSIRGGVWALAAASALFTLTACGSPAASGMDEDAPGMLQVGRTGELDGAHYELEARFILTGPESFGLDLGYTNSAANQELVPGAYTIAIQPGFRVLRDAAVTEVPVAAELSAEATRDFQILPAATTLVSYQFAVVGGMLSFDGE